MVPVVLSILVVVLISGAVLWVVAGEIDQPTSEGRSTAARARDVDAIAPVVSTPLVTTRRPASRRRAAAVSTPAELVAARVAPIDPPSPPRPTVRASHAAVPRHRARSTVLLFVLIVVVGVLLAVLIGAVLAALAFALRAAVTS